MPIVHLEELLDISVDIEKISSFQSIAEFVPYLAGCEHRASALGKFKSGAAYLAKHLGTKIIPVTIGGSFEILPRGKAVLRFFGRHRGTLRIGEPVNPDRFDSIEALNDHLRGIIQTQAESHDPPSRK
jgi:hypothetical protein